MNLILRWVFFALALLFVAWIVPGISIHGFFTALIAALVIGIVNAVIRPVIAFFTLPINVLTLGLFSFIINALMLMLAAFIVPGFTVAGFGAALLGSLLLTILSVIINMTVTRTAGGPAY